MGDEENRAKSYEIKTKDLVRFRDLFLVYNNIALCVGDAVKVAVKGITYR